MSWIDPELASYFQAAEDRYIQWCEARGVEPFRCEVKDCDRWLPCREHRDEAHSIADTRELAKYGVIDDGLNEDDFVTLRDHHDNTDTSDLLEEPTGEHAVGCQKWGDDMDILPCNCGFEEEL